MEILYTLIILIFSAIVHEVSHGVVAEKLGDSTARDEGRITLNPIPHIDPFGSILLPGFLMLVGSPIVFGAAKPVPVNFDRLRPRKLGMALVSLAGPFSNFILAALLILPLKFGLIAAGPVADIWLKAVVINIILGTFNLIPIPPLDGSKVIASMLPDTLMYWILSLERYGFFIVLIFLYLGLLDKILLPVIETFFRVFGIQI
jgi:Zn-dependent protease